MDKSKSRHKMDSDQQRPPSNWPRLQFANNQVSMQITFSPKQRLFMGNERKLGPLIARMNERREFFFGIEISTRCKSAIALNYENFDTLLPLFTSITWQDTVFDSIEPISSVESMQLARGLQKKTLVLPHFTCYRASNQRVTDFVELNFSNVLALRGDFTDAQQAFKTAGELVSELRRLRGDTISIGVAGYPEGHWEANSLVDDIKALTIKVNCGADFIITESCFYADKTLTFIRNCRQKGIAVPILIGVFVPDDVAMLMYALELSKATLSAQDLSKYTALANTPADFRQYAVNQCVAYLSEILTSDLGITGAFFYTMNAFRNVVNVINQLSAHRVIRIMFPSSIRNTR